MFNNSLHVFIISWHGQHENAIFITQQISSFVTTTIVYSDPNQNLELASDIESIRRPNNLYWGDKFKTCLDACKKEHLMIIHADCKCNDWLRLIDAFIYSSNKFKNLGIWSPLIDWSGFAFDVSKIARLNPPNLNLVALADGMIFSINRSIIERMRKIDYKHNIYGWGISTYCAAYAHLQQYPVVTDTSIKVYHPKSSGYDRLTAGKLAVNFSKQFSLAERSQVALLKSYVKYNRILLNKRDKS